MLDRTARDWLVRQIGTAVRFDEPMARHTTFQIGGPADAWVEPLDETQLRQLVQWADGQSIPYLIVGAGTNLLVRDGGVRGLVIRLNRMATAVSSLASGGQVLVKAGAGLPTRRLCALALRHGWQGMNFALGIPGTLGGAVAMNAGTGRGCMADVLVGLSVLTDKAARHDLSRQDFGWGYRSLCLPASLGVSPVLLEADIVLEIGRPETVRAEAQQIIQARVRRQPVRMAGAGCFFKNPSSQMAAGRLIDEAGLKGMTIGQAQVSPVHANFIVNLGGATAADVIGLADSIHETVWDRFRIRLEAEVKIVGEAIGAESAQKSS